MIAIHLHAPNEDVGWEEIQYPSQILLPEEVEDQTNDDGGQPKEEEKRGERVRAVSLSLHDYVRERLSERYVLNHLQSDAVVEIGSERHHQLTDDGAEKEHSYAESLLVRKGKLAVHYETTVIFGFFFRRRRRRCVVVRMRRRRRRLPPHREVRHAEGYGHHQVEQRHEQNRGDLRRGALHAPPLSVQRGPSPLSTAGIEGDVMLPLGITSRTRRFSPIVSIATVFFFVVDAIIAIFHQRCVLRREHALAQAPIRRRDGVGDGHLLHHVHRS